MRKAEAGAHASGFNQSVDLRRLRRENLATGGLLFRGSMADFRSVSGRNLLARVERFHRWQERRRSFGWWPYSNAIHEAPRPRVRASSESGELRTGLNFASQDYLALAAHPRILEAAGEGLRRYGAHSAGSPALQGNTAASRALEAALAEHVGMEHVVLFPTGWMAGFGAIRGLVRPDDVVILDRLAHNCLAEGAAAATRHILRASHNEIDHFRGLLAETRRRHPQAGILIVTEGLFSMDADVPDLGALRELAGEFEATLLVDQAHDLGSMGPQGTGAIGAQGLLGQLDLVMGAFSKTFASNGGFIATRSAAVKQYLKFFAPSNTFSNALSPMQCAVIAEALAIVRSKEGDMRRKALFEGVGALRKVLAERKVPCLGVPSPIVPVPLGGEVAARIASKKAFERGLFANLVEYPAVAPGNARFRMQMMASHTMEDAVEAAGMLADLVEEARAEATALCAGDTPAVAAGGR